MVDRIHKGEYVEMADLLPEFWVAPREGEEATAQKLAKSRGRRRTQDICVWSRHLCGSNVYEVAPTDTRDDGLYGPDYKG